MAITKVITPDLIDLKNSQLASGVATTYVVTVPAYDDPGTANKYFVNGVQQPNIVLIPGTQYVITQDDVSNASHPILLSTSIANSGVYSTGVVYSLNGANVSYSSYISGFAAATQRKITVTLSSPPATLYYVCYYHQNMGNTVITVGGALNTDGVVLPKGTTSVTAVIDYLVIAGGGGGGSLGGGGGAGGYRNSFNNESSGGGGSSETNLIASIGAALDIKVGDGGAGSTSQGGGVPGVNGTNSTFSTITSIGGGGGGSNPSNDGVDGGSGGGTPSATNSGKVGGDGELNQGFNGGNPTAGTRSPAYGGGGGGGAGGLGGDGTSANGGAGGIGLQSNITNTQTFRAGGGGAGAQGGGGAGSGGSGIGGNGTPNNTTGGNGIINTGSGGGGGGSSGGYGGGGVGGSGVIILRTPSNTTAVFSGGVTANGSTGGSIAPDTSTGDNVWIVTATTNSTQTVTFSATGDGTGRPTTNLSDGEFRYNTTTKKVEFYDGTAWFALTSSVSVPQAGTTGACSYPTTATALFQLDNNIVDTCGNHTAAWSGTAAYSSTAKFGSYSAYLTGGTGGPFINTGINPNTNPNWTVSFWVYRTQTTRWAWILGSTVGAYSVTEGFAMRIQRPAIGNGFIEFSINSSYTHARFDGGSVSGNSWEHIAVTHNASANITGYPAGDGVTTVYQNGALITTNIQYGQNPLPNNGFNGVSQANWCLGSPGTYNPTFNERLEGYMDQARFFNSELNATQIEQLYNETAP